MHLDHLHSVVPLERYRLITAALDPECGSWLDEFWLRMAAQVAVLAPDEPPRLAERIRHLGEALVGHAKWYQDLASPLRFVVAAMLIQHRIKVHEFVSEHARIADLLQRVGLRSSGFHHTMTVLILMITAEHAGFGMLEAERLKAIHDAMKRFHWWLTGPDDLPACAALAHSHGSAIEVVNRTEACYQLLHASGLQRGHHLQTAANLLPLGGLAPDVAVARYRGLRSRLEADQGPLSPTHYEALSLLSLLDHEPGVVVDRLLAVFRELQLFQPDVVAAANLIIAADLTCFDLVRFDRAQQSLARGPREAEMLRALHTFRVAAAASLSRIDVDLALPATGLSMVGWPQPL